MSTIQTIRNYFQGINFESFEVEHNEYLCADIDYLGYVGKKAFGIQIKPVAVNANLGNYDVSARMQQSFRDFEEQYSGKVFIVLSIDGEIANKEIIAEIGQEINRLGKLK